MTGFARPASDGIAAAATKKTTIDSGTLT